jgi:hypothetical protein
MLGMLEVLEKASKVTKKPQDIFFVDLDNKAQWKIIKKEELDKLTLPH